jgi:alpha-1,3-glucan synthase
LAFSQIIGSICVMVARATAPNRIGPESVFPDAGTWDFQSSGLKGSPMASAPFWVALACQLIIVVGYFWFYRKEQLGKSMHGLLRETFRIDMCASTSMMAISFLHLPCTHEVYS